MSKIQWYINRLKAMNVREVMWRLDQKRIEKQEASRFGNRRVNVGSEVFDASLAILSFDSNALGINFANTSYNTCTEIHLLKGLDNDKWPDTFSYSLNYKQRDDLGDARSNWEKNRHFDWALKAKRLFVLSNINFHELDINLPLIDGCDDKTKTEKTADVCVSNSLTENSSDGSTGSPQRLGSSVKESSTGSNAADGQSSVKNNKNISLESEFEELEREVTEWMEKNPFLHGISWTSAMEFAIRSINWMYALAFLEKTRESNCLADEYKTKTIKTPSSMAGSSNLSLDESSVASENKLSASTANSSNDIMTDAAIVDGNKPEKPFVADERLEVVCGKLRNGIINITEYLTKHYSRFSSANNHLLVEATAIGLAGYAFGHKPWQELAVRILTEELPKQNYSDGVNKELSLHYQTFGMEAYLLLMHAAQANDNDDDYDNCLAGEEIKTKTIKTPEGSVSNEESEIESKLSSSAASSSTGSDTASSNPSGKKQEINLSWKSWIPMLQKEAEFVAHSTWREKTVCEFGDDDEGKILDLQGGEWHQWEWVLQLASLVTGVRYSRFEEVCENTRWLFTEEEIESIKRKPYFAGGVKTKTEKTADVCVSNSLTENSSELASSVKESSTGSNAADGQPSVKNNKNISSDCKLGSRVFAEGGNSFLRDKEDRVLIGIDHAELGFGSIAAHGHADALSFQMLVDGVPVFADPGTYIYHCWIEERDKFRKTINHNTLAIASNDNDNENDNLSRWRDQSKMLGAFMWGERANCRLVDYEIGDEKDVLIAEHDGYKPCIHRRKFEFDKVGLTLTIKDQLSNDNDNENDNLRYAVTFMLGADVAIRNDNHNASTGSAQAHNDNWVLETKTAVIRMLFEGADLIAIEDAELSSEYGVKVPTKAIRLYGHEKTITTQISVRFK